MSHLFWPDIITLCFSILISTALVIIVLGVTPRRVLNWAFALFVLAETAWIGCALLLRFSLWLNPVLPAGTTIGRPDRWLEWMAVSIGLMSVFALLFTVLYLGRRNLRTDITIIIGVLLVIAFAVPVFQHRLLLNPQIDADGSVIEDVSIWGGIGAILIIVYLVISLIFLWQERSRADTMHLAVGILILLVGVVAGGIFDAPFPFSMSVTNLVGVALIGYKVVAQQLFNPLREQTIVLQREITERQRAEEQASRRAQNLLAISDLAVQCANAPRETDILKLTAETLQSITKALAVSVSTYDAETNELTVKHIAVHGAILSGVNKLIGQNMIGMTIQVSPEWMDRMLTQVVTSVDNLTETTFGLIPRPISAAVQRAFGIGTFTGLALHDGSELIGTAVIVTSKDQPPISMDVAKTFAHVATVSLRRKEAEENLCRRNRELELLNSAGRAFNSSLDPDAVLVTVLDEIRQMFGVVACSAWMIDPQTNELVCRQSASPKSEIVRGHRLTLEQGIVGWAASHDTGVIVPDTQTEQRYYDGIDRITGLWLRSLLAVPLRIKEQVIGVIEVVDVHPERFTAADLTLVESLALTAATAIENASLYDQAQKDNAEKEKLLHELEDALDKVKTLKGLLPICAHCKKIRDDDGYWHQVEIYVESHSQAQFSHGICPDCQHELYPPDVYPYLYESSE